MNTDQLFVLIHVLGLEVNKTSFSFSNDSASLQFLSHIDCGHLHLDEAVERNFALGIRSDRPTVAHNFLELGVNRSNLCLAELLVFGHGLHGSLLFHVN